MKFNYLDKKDKKLSGIIKKEIKRQEETLDLIASENLAPKGVLEALGSPLVNKYSEGYPGVRYYPGNKFYDEIEILAQERALKAFQLKLEEWGVNVQPYSGSPANLAVYMALIQPGDMIMGMKLSSGGHLTHGHKASATGKFFQSVQYGVRDDGRINYDEILKLAIEHKPKIIITGATAYPREIDFKKLGEIAKKVGAYHVADISHIAGLVAAGEHLSPFPYADVVTMTTQKTLRGPRGAVIFARKKLIKTDSRVSGNEKKDSKSEKGKKNKKEETIFDRKNKAVFPGLQGGPHNNQTAAIAYMFLEAAKPEFKRIQKQIIKNAAVLAEKLKEKDFNLVTGGTDNHLILIDVRNFGLDGWEAEHLLEDIGIVANRNSVPGDDKPFHPSGIRMGTAFLSSRGMKEKEMKKIADIIFRRLVHKEAAEKLKKEVFVLCKNFPLEY
ncbi:MAG: serine hydroxymethyltransferase [Candidatus Pacebacteria bacterium]|nr:serine hydroxymethyltransferase [Candidatus Paceibacterota bacterium]